MDREQRAHAVDLCRHTVRREHLGKLLGHALALAVELRENIRRQLPHAGQARGHPERVPVVGPALGEVRLVSRVKHLHHVRAAAERGDRQAAADDLAQRRQVRCDAVHLLRAPGPNAKRDDLVEDEKDPELACHVAKALQELWARRDHAAGADDGLEDDRGHRRGLAPQNRLRGVGVVEGQHDYVLERPLGRADRVGHGDRRVGRPRLVHDRVCAHLCVVVGPVVAALDARDLRPACERACQAHREHGCLGAGVAEAHRVEARHALT